MVREKINLRKLGCLMIVFIVWIVGTSFIAGCVTTTTTGTGAAKLNNPYIANQIKEGVTTKPEVRRLLGNPNSVQRLIDGVEVWSYHADNMAANSATDTVVTASSSMFTSMIPISGIGFANIAAQNAIRTGQSAESYDGTVTFDADGIVIAVSSMSQGKPSLWSNAGMFQTTKTNKPTVTTHTKQQSPVYSNNSSRTYHYRNCSELSTGKLMEFNSSQDARKAGGVPCKQCNPS